MLELLELVDERVYLFVDDAARHVRELVSLIRQTHSERRRITYVLGERLNEWNVYGGPLASFITNEFVVEYLESNEIDQLLSLLEKHKALGTLEKLSKADRAVSTSVRQPVSEFTVAPPRARSGRWAGRREAVAVCL